MRGGEIAIEQPRNWMEVHAGDGDNAGEYRFDVSGPYPVDRVRIGLPQSNTIATAELLVRSTPPSTGARSRALWSIASRVTVIRS